MMEVRQAIEDAGLMHQPRYALFFAERCLFEAVQAGKYGCWKESIQFADWALAHFPGSVLKTQALAAAVATRAFHHFGISPRITTTLLIRLFKMHKRLHPVSLHLHRVP
jgi:hypothetical protein